MYPGDWIVANHAEFLKRRSLGQRLGAVMAQDEAEAMNSYLEAARNGEAIVLVQARSGSDAELEHIRSRLAQQGGRLMRYYGRGFVRDLVD